jgi:hypothetical protein
MPTNLMGLILRPLPSSGMKMWWKICPLFWLENCTIKFDPTATQSNAQLFNLQVDLLLGGEDLVKVTLSRALK